MNFSDNHIGFSIKFYCENHILKFCLDVMEVDMAILAVCSILSNFELMSLIPIIIQLIQLCEKIF